MPKKTSYPYPLESNRGSLVAYGTMTHVWFYDNGDKYIGKSSLLIWMKEHGRLEELKSYNGSHWGKLES